MTKITQEMFKKALEGSIGTQRDLATILKVSDSAIDQYLKRNPSMKKLFDEKRLSNVGKSEHVMFGLLDFDEYEKEPSSAAKIRQSSAQFILKNLGKDHGWVEKQQIEQRTELIDKTAREIHDELQRKDNKRSDKK